MANKILITGVAGLLGSRLASWILENTDNVIVIEEHSKSGGLGSIFNDVAAENNFSTKLNFIGFENKQLLEYGSREWFHKEAKIDIKSLTEKILRIL